MNMVRLVEIENRIWQFPIAAELWLVERVARHIREQRAAGTPLWGQLAAMAADPNIQRELRAIEKEFDVCAISAA